MFVLKMFSIWFFNIFYLIYVLKWMVFKDILYLVKVIKFKIIKKKKNLERLFIYFVNVNIKNI